jgi:hypothetical protein
MFWSFLKRRALDERFILHRYKSTSHASMVAASVMGAWIIYDSVRNDVLRWDFIAVMGTMVVVKIGFMIYYTARD